MKYENKTLKEYCENGQLKIGGFVYSYMLGIVVEYKLIKIDESVYDDSLWAVLEPQRLLSHESPKKWKPTVHYGSMRANYDLDTRFSLNVEWCLRASITSLNAHIESSQRQVRQAEKILDNIS